MDSFLFAFAAVLLLSIGGRDQIMVARFSAKLGQSGALLGVAVLVSAASAGVMAYAGAHIAVLLPVPAQHMLIAIALAIAALELFWPVRLREATEPTRSLGAIGIVLFARQIGDAARFAVFAFAAATVLAPLAWLGGALGGAGAMLLAWTLQGELEDRFPLRRVRIALGIVVLLIAAWIALSARGAV